MKNPNIYFDFTIMDGCFNFSLFSSPKWKLLDIRFSIEVNQIVLFNKELYFNFKSKK